LIQELAGPGIGPGNRSAKRAGHDFVAEQRGGRAVGCDAGGASPEQSAVLGAKRIDISLAAGARAVDNPAGQGRSRAERVAARWSAH